MTLNDLDPYVRYGLPAAFLLMTIGIFACGAIRDRRERLENRRRAASRFFI